MPNIHVIKNALLNHKIAAMRDKDTPVATFRSLVHDVAIIEMAEALRDFPTLTKEITTPLETTPQQVIDESKICLVPILRAGLGMSDSISSLLPHAPVGHIGMYRDETTHEAHEYYSRFPKDLGSKHVFLLDPMLATGGSAIDAIRQLRAHGAKEITFLCIIAAPEGVEKVKKEFPEVPVYIGALDRELNSNCYILPGLGDAGDRIFGTVD